MDNSENRMLNEREAAVFLGISVGTLQNWRSASFGPQFCKFGRAVRYPSSELQKYVADNLVTLGN